MSPTLSKMWHKSTTSHFWTLLTNFGPKMSQKTSQKGPEATPRCPWTPQNDTQAIPKTSQIRPGSQNVRPGSLQGSKWCQNGRPRDLQASKWSQNASKMRPKWYENPAQMVSRMKRRNHGLRKPVQRRNHETYCTHEIPKLNVGNVEGRRKRR